MAVLTGGGKGRGRSTEGEASSFAHRASRVSPSSTTAHISSTAAFTAESILLFFFFLCFQFHSTSPVPPPYVTLTQESSPSLYSGSFFLSGSQINLFERFEGR